MMCTLCASRRYVLFATRYQELKNLIVFPEDFKVPECFAEEINEKLDLYDGHDLNVTHSMVLFLLMSTLPVSC